MHLKQSNVRNIVIKQSNERYFRAKQNNNASNQLPVSMPAMLPVNNHLIKHKEHSLICVSLINNNLKNLDKSMF